MPKPPIPAVAEAPFALDLLKRASVVNLLREVIADTDAPISIGLAAPWGSGKSSVLNLLTADIEKRDMRWLVCRFDAWANEDVGDPILGLTEEITQSLKTLSTSLTWRVRRNLNRFASGIADLTLVGTTAIAASVQLSHPVGWGIAAGVTATAAKVARKAAKARREKLAADVKVARANYRNEIQAAVRTVREIFEGGGCKIVVIVDDLDRCNPAFALKTLERMKHFFDIPGVSFILAYDPAYVRSAAQAIYGSALDAERYFRRFVDFEFGLPQPDMSAFVQHEMQSLNLIAPYHELPTIIHELVTHIRPVMEPRDIQAFLAAIVVARKAFHGSALAHAIVPPLLASRYISPDDFASAIRTDGPFKSLLKSVTKFLESSKESQLVARLNILADVIDMPAGWIQNALSPPPPTPPPAGLAKQMYEALMTFTANNTQPACVAVGQLLRYASAVGRLDI